MNQLRSVNFDVLKRPRVLWAIGVVIALLLAFYFAWWSPEGNKLSAVNATRAQQASQITSLHGELATVIAEGKFVKKYQTFLTFFGSQVPVQPEQGQLIDMLGKLSSSDKVTITTVSANSVVAAKPPAFSTIPVTLTATGAHANLVKFLSDLYNLPRLITIQTVTPTPNGGGTNLNVLARDSVPYTLTISGTAYFTGTPATTPAAG